MGDATSPDAASQRFTASVDGQKRPAGFYPSSLTQTTTEPRSGFRKLNYSLEPSPVCSAVHDFERRLSRNGIKVSEVTSTATRAFVRDRGGALSDHHRYGRASIQQGSSHYMSRSEDFGSLEAPTMASFTNVQEEIRVEALERQLRQTQTEAKIWKERCEAQEANLRTSYKETMDWRMKYEDLYSAVLRGVDEGPPSRTRRGATKSLG